jgi:acyl dehydratase
LDYSRVVHGDQRFEYSRPIIAGDELIARVRIDAIRSVAGNDMITTKAELSTTDGEHVVTSYSLLVARGTDEGSA